MSILTSEAERADWLQLADRAVILLHILQTRLYLANLEEHPEKEVASRLFASDHYLGSADRSIRDAMKQIEELSK